VVCDDKDNCIYFKGEFSMMKFDYDSQNADIAHFGYRNDNNRVDLKVQGKNSVNSTFYNKEKKLLDVDVI
jgi:hypothetical protein